MGLFSFLRKKDESDLRISSFECSREGLTIRGTQYRPEGDKLPIAIVSHGFMANQQSVAQYAAALARMGWCAFTFDFCGGSVPGTGKSDGDTTRMSVLTEVRDLEAVMAYARILPYTGDKLILGGCSQGGFVSALTAAKHPLEVAGLVLFYPALCIPDDARAGRMMFARFDPENIPQEFSCGPMKLGRCYAADVIGMDPITEIRGYPGPVLILHGSKDRLVLPQYSRQAQAAYPNGELHIIEGAGHGFGKRHDAIAIAHLKKFAGTVRD